MSRVLSSSIRARILELSIHMDDELWYVMIENQAHCSCISLYLSIFLSFQDKFVSHFSQELCKLDTSYLVYR